MKHDVFISHAPKDKSIAEAICGKLESAHLKCWAAARGVSPREGWTEANRKAIGSSRVIVLVLSENANAAPHIQKEIAHAFYMRRIIIPFRLAETLPPREILFYLGDVPWFNALNPPTEEQLEALTARIKGLMPDSTDAGDATPPQNETKKTASLSPSNSWFGALNASRYRTLGILRRVAIATFLCAVVLFLWFVLRQTTEWASLAESHRRSMDRGFSLSPTPSPQAGGDTLGSKQTSAFTRFGSWQVADDGGPKPLVQGPQDPPLNTPTERSADATSSPPREVTPAERAGGLTSEPRPRHLPLVTHRVSHDHHQQFPGTQVREARKIADLENQRDSLQRQLRETEEKVLAIQKNADLVTSQRDELQTRLNESQEKAQIAQKNADIVARQRDELRDQLKETENRALTVQKNEELVSTQRDALQTRLKETEGEVQAAQKNADFATRQRDALQSELGEVRESAQLAETKANLAASQRDAMEAELKKKGQEKAQEKKAQLNQRGSDLAELPTSAPDTQFQVVRQDARPAHEDAEFAQTQPPNPGQNATPAPLTQTLDSSVQATGPSRD
jgi:TIR domain